MALGDSESKDKALGMPTHRFLEDRTQSVPLVESSLLEEKVLTTLPLCPSISFRFKKMKMTMLSEIGDLEIPCFLSLDLSLSAHLHPCEWSHEFIKGTVIGEEEIWRE